MLTNPPNIPNAMGIVAPGTGRPKSDDATMTTRATMNRAMNATNNRVVTSRTRWTCVDGTSPACAAGLVKRSASIGRSGSTATYLWKGLVELRGGTQATTLGPKQMGLAYNRERGCTTVNTVPLRMWTRGGGVVGRSGRGRTVHAFGSDGTP